MMLVYLFFAACLGALIGLVVALVALHYILTSHVSHLLNTDSIVSPSSFKRQKQAMLFDGVDEAKEDKAAIVAKNDANGIDTPLEDIL